MRRLFLIAAMGCGGPSAANEDLPPSQAPPGFWDHWGDGRAELARYDLVQPRYGEARAGSAVLVFVTEDLSRATRVKSDGAADRFPVIKLNEVRDFTTGLYDYNVMQSSFVPLDGSLPLGQPTKLALSVQEWCGQIYEQWTVDPGRARVDRHSYFEGEADERRTVAIPEGAVFADSWPLVVRGLAGERFAPGSTTTVPWMPPLLQARFAHAPAAFTTAVIRRSAAPAPIEVPAGTFEAWEVQVDEAGGRSTKWWVEVPSPHRLVRWEASDGEQAVLTHVIREPYWRLNHDSDTPQRARLGL